ncbi:MAG: glycosyltransferase [Opitutales bacterium]|nr:glycosyltransferase [Opitutales bacterium]
MKILTITSELPYPPNYGGARLRQFELLKRLTNDHEIHLVTFWETEEDRKLTSHLDSVFTSVSAMMKPEPQSPSFSDRFKVPYWRLTWSESMAKLIEDKIDQLSPDVVYVTPSHMAFYSPYFKKTPAWIDATDSGELHALSNLSVAKNFKEKLQGFIKLRAVKQYEKHWYPKFQGASLVAGPDADAVKRLCPKLPIEVIENGVDTTYFAPLDNIKKKKHIVFTGTMDFSPNIDAVEWFCSEIFPSLKARHPELEFDIVGRAPTQEVKALAAQPGVNLHGFVPDLRKVVQEAWFYVCPMRKGAGMKNKLLEAMAMEMPIVSTSAGAQGLNIANAKEAQLCRTSSEFIEECLKLLDLPSELKRMGEAGREYVLKNHCWNQSAQKLEGILNALASS